MEHQSGSGRATRLQMTCGLSVVVPCYNEEDGVVELHRRLTAVCRKVCGDGYEIVLVNDGSKDATWKLITHLTERDPQVVGVNLSRNYGHQVALTAGLSICRGDRVLIVDADLQDPPEMLSAMMSMMDDGADVVYGQRVRRHGESWFKKATASLFYSVLCHLSSVEIPRDTGDFRLISRRVLEVLQNMPEQQRFMRGMISWMGFRQVPVRYERAVRFAGETKYPFRKMVRFAIDGITGFSVRPLRVASYLGLLFALASALMIGYALYSWWSDVTVPGWTSVMTVLLLLGSVQMLVLGVMGEYLGRLFIEAKRRPLFLIDKVLYGSQLARQDQDRTKTTRRFIK
jgi:polyisoprenyl-phosphate glycosyltransferase